jgi:hypothetical protein
VQIAFELIFEFERGIRTVHTAFHGMPHQKGAAAGAVVAARTVVADTTAEFGKK